MLPGPVAFNESIRSGIDRHILPTKELPVQPHRADLDTNSAGRDPFLVQLIAVLGAVLLICQTKGIILLVKSPGRAHLHATHAFGA